MPKLTIFYDGQCPLCVKEMEKLKSYDNDSSLHLVNTHSEEFVNYPEIDPQEASRVLHAINDQNQLLLGLDVTYLAWKLVGKGWVYAPLRWPLVRPMADWAYLRFANNRYAVSKLLTGKSKCDNDQCSL